MPRVADNARVILVTAPDVDVARRIARRVLDERRAACVNLLPGVTSLYWWEGKIDEQAEALLIIKTMANQVSAIIDTIKQDHPYEVPEIIALPIVEGDETYLNWLSGALHQHEKPSSPVNRTKEHE